MIEYLIAIIVQFKYLAIFGSLTVAGFGVPVPEEATLVISGYLVATGHMVFGYAFLICYLGVITGDIITYSLGRFGGRMVLGTRWMRWVVSTRRLAQVQYYYRRHGPRSLLLSRQLPGVRFPSFFTAGMLKMPFFWFLVYDAAAALVSMPLVFFLSYFFGPLGLHYLVQLALTIRDVASVVVVALLVLGGTTYWVYRSWWKRSAVVGTDETQAESSRSK